MGNSQASLVDDHTETNSFRRKRENISRDEHILILKEELSILGPKETITLEEELQ